MSTAGASKAYDSLFGSFGLRENPFSVSPDPRFLFSGPAHQTAIAELMFGVQSRRGLHVLTGEAGTGKTTLMRSFLQWLAKRHYSTSYVFHTHLASAELFELVLRDFGVTVDSAKKADLVAALHRWLLARRAVGDTPVLIIDEAQALSVRALSELRLLLNLENHDGKLLQIVLAGQPELVEKLRRPELSALRQRMMVHCRLPVLTLEDTGEYINARLCGAGAAAPQIFSPETVQTLYSFARGIPRVTNLLCERAMIEAYAEKLTVVSPAHVRKVAAEYDLEGAAPNSLIDDALPPTERAPSAVAKAALISPAKPLVESHFVPGKTPEANPANITKPAVPVPVSAAAPVSAPVPADSFAPALAPTPQPTKPLVESHFGPGKTPETNPPNINKPAVPVPVSAAAPVSVPVPAVRFAPAAPAPQPAKPLVESHFASGKTPKASPANTTKPAVPAAVSAAAGASDPAPAVWFASTPAPQPAKPKEKHDKEFIVEFCLDSTEQQESPKIVGGFDWRKFHPESHFKGYWAEVWKTFLRDVRALYSSVASLLKSLAQNVRVLQADLRGFYRSAAPKLASFARNLRPARFDGHRKLFGTFSSWLRRPIKPARPRVPGPATPQARTGKS